MAAVFAAALGISHATAPGGQDLEGHAVQHGQDQVPANTAEDTMAAADRTGASFRNMRTPARG